MTIGTVSVAGNLGELFATSAADYHLNDGRGERRATLGNHASSRQGMGGREGSVPGPGHHVFMAECVCVRCSESAVSWRARVSL